MLEFIHKWVLGLAPPALRSLFAFRSQSHVHSTRQARNRHCKQIVDPFCSGDYWNRSALLRRSVDGLIGIYNRLPDHVVGRATVSDFQRDLTMGALDAVNQGAGFEDLCALCFV